MNEASTAFPDPENWIELPGVAARMHRDDLRPCLGCGSRYFNVVRVSRQAAKPNDDGTFDWTQSVAVECPTCRLESVKWSDRRQVLGKMDMQTGQIHDTQREYAGHGNPR